MFLLVSSIRQTDRQSSGRPYSHAYSRLPSSLNAAWVKECSGLARSVSRKEPASVSLLRGFRGNKPAGNMEDLLNGRVQDRLSTDKRYRRMLRDRRSNQSRKPLMLRAIQNLTPFTSQKINLLGSVSHFKYEFHHLLACLVPARMFPQATTWA
jgi:hypothetical protein